MYLPKHYKIVSGSGKSKLPLVAFDKALIDAGIGNFNLVKVSSILPAHCMYSEEITLTPGSIIYAAYASVTITKGESGQTAVAVAISENSDENGVIFETSSKENIENCELLVENMCTEAMEERNRKIKIIEKSSQKIIAENDMFLSAISAVVMW